VLAEGVARVELRTHRWLIVAFAALIALAVVFWALTGHGLQVGFGSPTAQ